MSFLVLLFVAMPLKYLAGLPLAVRIAGSVHGVLFIAFVLALIWASVARRWPFHRSLLAFASSIVPFGTFAFDVSLRREIAASREAERSFDPNPNPTARRRGRAAPPIPAMPAGEERGRKPGR